MTRFYRLPFGKVDLLFVLAAPLTGVLCAFSTERWMDGLESGRVDLERSREDLVRSAGLFELHNAVYSRVGERAWENEVKPDFLRALTYATIADTGDILPEAQDIVFWVRKNPARAREMLERAEAAHHARAEGLSLKSPARRTMMKTSSPPR